jgi:hypothetical protein
MGKFMSLVVGALLSALTLSGAFAQSSPSPAFYFGYVPTAGQWNSYFQSKQDYLGASPLLTTGGTLTGKVYTLPSSVAQAGLNVGQGVAPSLPQNGDIWMTAAGLVYQAGGVTYGPFGAFGVISGTLLQTNAAAYNLSQNMTGDLSITSGNVTALNSNVVTYAKEAPAANNTVVGNPTSGSGNKQDMAMPSCSGPTGALTWTTNSGFGCNAAVGEPGFRNRLINGADDVDQRNSFAAQTITTTGAYTDDRFYAYPTGASVTGQNVAGVVGIARRAYQFTGAASVTSIWRCQRIESLSSWDLAGGTATLSAYLADSTLTTVSWAVSYANSADSFGSVASPTVTAISSGSWTINSTITRYSATVTIPSAAQTGLQVCLSVGAQTSGTWTILGVQFEAGSAVSPFERLPYGTTLALCQRFYWTYISTGGTGTFGGIGYAGAGGQVVGQYYMFPVQMRGTPTGAFLGSWTATNGTGTTLQTYNYGFVVWVTSLAAGYVQFWPPSTAGIYVQAEL